MNSAKLFLFHFFFLDYITKVPFIFIFIFTSDWPDFNLTSPTYWMIFDSSNLVNNDMWLTCQERFWFNVWISESFQLLKIQISFVRSTNVGTDILKCDDTSILSGFLNASDWPLLSCVQQICLWLAQGNQEHECNLSHFG